MTSENLVSWTVSYLKYRDTIFRKIKNIASLDNKVFVDLKNGGTDTYLCFNNLSDEQLKMLADVKFVCLNKKSNLDWVIKNWDSLSKTNVMILFVNPEKSESWAIHPNLHNSITEKIALKPGLLSLFESITEVK